ncbi:TPM domain-containing protein [Paenibacillus sp. MMS20-IR301]|uniref:TPM domain-containing protein n=1 Tax=Paenibacillus sp. MMS20-IR301 TaxID=2895946 RepID=UPI0028E70620|nr:TPM domain-containing protein [Paenibacillus sp. MMS20-IR301]WNS41872.1 TPM domain-containing protein [Paenibacillus sp. MMS20-IR301]
MRRILALVLIVSLLYVPAAYAADIPVRQGVVTDEAGLLTAQEAAAIAKAAVGDRYTVNILTIDELDGANSADYAEEVYNTWGLKTRDVLLLIAYGDQQTEISFNNPALQSELDAQSRNRGGKAGSAAITSLLENYFNPYARDGDFAGGISSVIRGLQAAGSVQGGTAGGVSGSTGSSGTAGTGGTGTAAQSGTGTGGLSFVTLAAGLAGAALLLVVLYVLIAGLRRRSLLVQQQGQLDGLLVRANRALESLQPFQGIVQGKTGEMVEGISQRLSAKLVEISALKSAGQGALPPFYRLTALKTAIAELQQAEDKFRTSLEEEEKGIAVVSDADRNVKQRITELKQDAPELDGQLQQAVKETGYALQDIAEDLQELAEETAKADQLELFDPIAAQVITDEAAERQEQIERDLQDVDAYDDKLKAFPGALAATRSRIAGLIEQNSLHNMKVKPYDSLEQAAAHAASLEASLRSGDMDEVRRIGAALDAQLAEAVSVTEHQAQIRQDNRRDLETVRSQWGVLTQRRNELQGKLAEAQNQFARQHLEGLRQTLEETGTALRQGAGEVPQLETWTSDARGEYGQARSGLDRLLALQDETAASFSSIDDNISALYERLDSLRRLFTEGQSRAEAAQGLLRSRGITAQSRFQLSLLPEYSELEQRLAARPYNLNELEGTGRSYASQISAFVEEAERLIRQKEEAERAARQAALLEQQRREQARRRMSSGPPSSGGFGGGNSSGGSSWGGGGRSSGGSSWGGGKSGGNSSGGSKW